LILLGGVWYLTGRLTAVTHVHDTYPLRVAAVDVGAGKITLRRGPDAAEPGTFRLAWPGGAARLGPVLSSQSGSVTRRLSAVLGRLHPGQKVGIEPNPYVGDPTTALGLSYTTVGVSTPLGAMPAWWIPGRRSTWVVLVHGLGGSRSDTLPAIPTLHELGYPLLAISYRNDIGSPPSPDRRSHLGATEWRDVAAAVSYARDQGAARVILFGFSLGGAMSLVAARDPAVQASVRAVILDSPILDWRATLEYAAGHHGIPLVLTELSEKVLAWRIHLDYTQFDELAQERSLRTPVLLIQGTADTVVPPAAASRYAKARPDLVTYLQVSGADHVSSIDTDPNAYHMAITTFLASHG